MKQDDIVTGLDSARMAVIKHLILALWAELTFLIKLKAEQRIGLQSVAQGRQTFVDLSAEIAAENWEKLMLNATERDRIARINVDLDMMKEILMLIDSLREGVFDTTLKIGSNCYQAGRMIYKLSQLAVERGEPGMEVAADTLGVLFKKAPKLPNETKDDGGDTTETDGNSDTGNVPA